MLAEKIVFNLLAFSLFIYILLKMFKKNDTSYLSLLLLQTIGIALNFVEILKWHSIGIVAKIAMYILAVILPALIVLIEKNRLSYLEFKNILLARLFILVRRNKIAKILLGNIIKKRNSNYMAHKLLAEIYEKEGGMRKAIEEYVHAIDIKRNDYDSYYKIGELLKQLGKKEEAKTMLENLINKKPDYINARILLAEILYNQENFKEALSILSTATQYNEIDYRIYYNLGMIYTRLNDFGNSRLSYEKAIELNSGIYLAYYNLGQIALLYNEIGKAEECFAKSIELGAIRAKALFQLSRISLIRKDNEKATELISKALAEDYTVIKYIDREPLFIAIRKDIRVQESQRERPNESAISKNEQLVIEHLERTYEIIERMGMQK